MSNAVQNRRGMALPATIFLLILVGAVVAAGFFLGIQNERAGDNTRRLQQSFAVAELGAFEQIRSWNAGWNSIAVYPASGGSPSISQASVSGVGSYAGKLFHLNTSQYLIDITGGDTRSQSGDFPAGGARQRIGLLVRKFPSLAAVKAAYVNGGGVGKFRGGYRITGNDSTISGWTGCTDQGIIPGFETSDTTAYKADGNSFSNVVGTPPVAQNTALTPEALDTIGNTGLTYEDLVAMATLTLPGTSYTGGPPMPVVSGTTCTTSVTSNWGSPLLPAGYCGTYYPIIHVTGDLRIDGTSATTTQGQGILLVDGNMKAFDFTFAGMVVIRGTLDSTHFFKVYGGVQVINKNHSAFKEDTWDVMFAYSSCALGKAFALAGPSGVSPLRSRSWAELY